VAGDPARESGADRAGRLKHRPMTVVAIFKYEIKPGRLPDFLKKLAEAADAKFASPTMPRSVRLFRSIVPGPDTGVTLMLEYEDMAAYGARTAFENANAEWRRLFEPAANAPEKLVSVELLMEVAAGLDEETTERVPFGFRA
jgi:NIPSNAP